MARLLPALLLLCSAAALANDHDDDGAWVVVRGDRGASMHGDMRDLKAARKYFSEFGPRYLWFRRDGKEYLVRDGKVIDRIDEATRPHRDAAGKLAPSIPANMAPAMQPGAFLFAAGFIEDGALPG